MRNYTILWKDNRTSVPSSSHFWASAHTHTYIYLHMTCRDMWAPPKRQRKSKWTTEHFQTQTSNQANMENWQSLPHCTAELYWSKTDHFTLLNFWASCINLSSTHIWISELEFDTCWENSLWFLYSDYLQKLLPRLYRVHTQVGVRQAVSFFST